MKTLHINLWVEEESVKLVVEEIKKRLK